MRHTTNHKTDLQDCGGLPRPLCPGSFGHRVLNGAIYYVWIRLRYVSITFESTLRIPGNKVAQEPHQTRRIPLKPFGIRLDGVSCNSIATRQFEQANLYVSIRLMQPFHRFVSGPLRLYTFGATLPQVLKSGIRFHTFLLRFIMFVLQFYTFC